MNDSFTAKDDYQRHKKQLKILFDPTNPLYSRKEEIIVHQKRKTTIISNTNQSNHSNNNQSNTNNQVNNSINYQINNTVINLTSSSQPISPAYSPLLSQLSKDHHELKDEEI